MSGERWYRLLLRAYPPGFRTHYEREMVLTFRQCRRDAEGRASLFWLELLWDVARSAPALRLQAMRAFGSNLHLMEAAMKTMGILTAVIGALEIVNSAIEGVGGGLHRPALQLLAVVLGVVGGVALMGAGIALIRRGPLASAHAIGAAVACLVAFAVIGLTAPIMSGFGMLLGIGFPIVLLVLLFVRRGRDGTLPRTA